MKIPASFEPMRFEPTVFGAVRRYRTMVLLFAIVGMLAAVGYTLIQGRTYRAQASVTVPHQVSLQGQDPAQYLDSQVLLLHTPDVARQAASIANAALHSNLLTARDFFGDGSSLEIIPPTAAASGVYGNSIIVLSFTSSSARIAQVGANAVLQALDDVRSATITAQARAVVTGIDHALKETSDLGERQALLRQRTQTLLDEETDLAHHPTAAWAAEPTNPVSGGWKRAAAIGFVIGIIAGAAAAYARASVGRSFADRRDPEALYGAPLIGEIPAFVAEKTSRPGASPGVGPLPVTADPHSAVAEAFRFAAGSVERVRAERGQRLALVFISPVAGVGKSTVVANLALAIAEGSMRVLAVDADTADDDLTAQLLPGTPAIDGFEQVLAGQRALADCVQPSPLNSSVAVLGSGPATPWRVRGAARSKAAGMLLAEAKASFDVVLIDSPALLEASDAAELVDASDAAIIVLGPNELIRDHLDMVDRLKLIGSDLVGYIYNRAPTRPHLSRHLRNRSPGRPTGSPTARPPAARPPALASTQSTAAGSHRPSGPSA
jgi:Mrp family chromosome partitioning ATPase